MAKIDDFADHLPRQLSGGMRQRASICRALMHDPSILLMDEPFSALDAMTRDEMGVELLRIWQANRKTVIFVTHSIREAVFLSDRVLVMGRRPATIIEELAIDLPRPRHIAMTEDESFNRLVRHLRKAIEASHAIDCANIVGRTRLADRHQRGHAWSIWEACGPRARHPQHHSAAAVGDPRSDHRAPRSPADASVALALPDRARISRFPSSAACWWPS